MFDISFEFCDLEEYIIKVRIVQMLSFERSSPRTRPINLCCIIIVVALSKDKGENGLEKKIMIIKDAV